MNFKLKDLLFFGIIIFLVVTGINAATYLYSADEVSYDNSNSSLVSTDVQSALDELYTKCNNSTTNLPSNHACIQKNIIKCKRATALHTEICTSSSTSYNCGGAGYALNDTIIYGNTTTIEGVLTVGDAFDCDVNGDGTFDATTERFYYVSDYYDTDRRKFNDKVAVLIYYSNTDDGVASTSSVAYDSSNENWHGPVTAINELPTTTQWSNISLYKSTRQILTRHNATETNGGTLPTNFNYSGYAARLITYQELLYGCYFFKTIMDTDGGLDNCYFLFEKTKYANSSLSTTGSWMESPKDSYSSLVYFSYSNTRGVSSISSNNVNGTGIRPVIEVLKSEILY